MHLIPENGQRVHAILQVNRKIHGKNRCKLPLTQVKVVTNGTQNEMHGILSPEIKMCIKSLTTICRSHSFTLDKNDKSSKYSDIDLSYINELIC